MDSCNQVPDDFFRKQREEQAAKTVAALAALLGLRDWRFDIHMVPRQVLQEELIQARSWPKLRARRATVVIGDLDQPGPRGELLGCLVHELLHVALAGVDAGYTGPDWVLEQAVEALEGAILSLWKDLEQKGWALTGAESERDTLLEALCSLGALPDGYCFCRQNRHSEEEEHEPECQYCRYVISTTSQPPDSVASRQKQLRERIKQLRVGAHKALRELIPTPEGPVSAPDNELYNVISGQRNLINDLEAELQMAYKSREEG